MDGYFHNYDCYVSKLHANSVFIIHFFTTNELPVFREDISPQLNIYC